MEKTKKATKKTTVKTAKKVILRKAGKLSMTLKAMKARKNRRVKVRAEKREKIAKSVKSFPRTKLAICNQPEIKIKEIEVKEIEVKEIKVISDTKKTKIEVKKIIKEALIKKWDSPQEIKSDKVITVPEKIKKTKKIVGNRQIVTGSTHGKLQQRTTGSRKVRNNWGHYEGTIGAKIDSMISKSNFTKKQIESFAGTKMSKVNSHINHLRKEKGFQVSISKMTKIVSFG